MNELPQAFLTGLVLYLHSSPSFYCSAVQLQHPRWAGRQHCGRGAVNIFWCFTSNLPSQAPDRGDRSCLTHPFWRAALSQCVLLQEKPAGQGGRITCSFQSHQEKALCTHFIFFFFLEEHKRREIPPRQPREGFTGDKTQPTVYSRPNFLRWESSKHWPQGKSHRCHISLWEGVSPPEHRPGMCPRCRMVSHMPWLGAGVPNVWHGNKAFCSAALPGSPGSNCSAGIHELCGTKGKHSAKRSNDDCSHWAWPTNW